MNRVGKEISGNETTVEILAFWSNNLTNAEIERLLWYVNFGKRSEINILLLLFYFNIDYNLNMNMYFFCYNICYFMLSIDQWLKFKGKKKTLIFVIAFFKVNEF